MAEDELLYVTLDGREGCEKLLFESNCLGVLSDRRMFLSMRDQTHRRDDNLLEKDNMYQNHPIQSAPVEMLQS